MNSWQIARHQVAIAGHVTDEETGKPLPGVAVTIVAMPQKFRQKLDLLAKARRVRTTTVADGLERTKTRADGLFYFLDLPDGDYTLSAFVPSQATRYGPIEKSVAVTRDGDGNLKLAPVNFTLQPTTLKGTVTETEHNAPVMLAEIRIKGSGECAFTNANGQYSLSGIESGQRTVVVTAQGYKMKTKLIRLEMSGASQTEDFNVARET
jgi:5-hydroxyisourate hydrolase-like protein (transthyretin family)